MTQYNQNNRTLFQTTPTQRNSSGFSKLHSFRLNTLWVGIAVVMSLGASSSVMAQKSTTNPSANLGLTSTLAQNRQVVSQAPASGFVGNSLNMDQTSYLVAQNNMGNVGNGSAAGTEGEAQSQSAQNVANKAPAPPAASLASKDSVLKAYQDEVKSVDVSPEFQKSFSDKVAAEVQAKQLEESQFFIAIDRGFKAQVLALAFYDKDKNSVSLSHFSPVSTGNTRKLHFITPTGWFENKVENGSYRAEGTKNSQGFRGYGAKGRRVWDFGWQKAQPGWIKKEEERDIRFQMHATDPALAESKLGTPQSQGCVRVHSTANAFFDKYGIIDKEYETANYWALLKNRTPVEFAGNKILVVETGLEINPKATVEPAVEAKKSNTGHKKSKQTGTEATPSEDTDNSSGNSTPAPEAQLAPTPQSVQPAAQ